MSLRIALRSAAIAAWLVSAAAVAEPTIDQVYKAASSGQLEQARSMMAEVLKAHPESPKAHFVEAELLARQGDTEGARLELQKARTLNPQLSFARPESVAALERALGLRSETAIGARSAAAATHSGGIPGWAWVMGLAALLGLVLWKRQRPNPDPRFTGRATGDGMPMPTDPYNPYGAAAYPPAPAPSAGRSLLGSLATGAAIGGGLVAGEALAHRLLDSDTPHHGGDNHPGLLDSSSGAGDSTLGGDDFGISDSSSWDDSSNDSW